MTTIYNIAKQAKVSPATVSRVLNGYAVKPSTKARIERIIDKHGYTPDSRAQGLKHKKSNKIGLIIPDISNPIYPEIVKIIHDLMRQKGYHLILANTYGDISEEREILKMMQRERIAGLIMSTVEGKDDRELNSIFKEFIDDKTQILFFGKNTNGLPVDDITVDNYTGILKITQYLIRIGRRKIGLISGERGLRVIEERISGYMNALKEAGIAIDKDLMICRNKQNQENGEESGELLMTTKKVDAIVCLNDMIAIGVLNVAEKLQLSVPGDIAVTGFDDISLASIVKPRLTTVRQPNELIVTTGCERLLKRIEGESVDPKSILFEPEIIVRESA